jgi:two-component sensor histidine kinase
VKDEKILNVLKDSQNRIKSMSFIHESLYQTKNFSNINFTEYVTELSKNLVHSYSNYEGDVKLKLDIQNVFLNLDLAIPCGLIVNEILSNALKYAFKEKTGKEELNIKMIVKGNELVLMIGDNGIGLPKGIDFKNTDSLGLQIVTTLVEQLNGTIELDSAKAGTNYIIKFKHNQIKNRI